jgi:Uma2 family endonuclease
MSYGRIGDIEAQANYPALEAIDKMTLVKSRAYSRGQQILELIDYFPDQGNWSEAAYLALETSRFIEFDQGNLEFLPMPTRAHQLIVLYLYRLLWQYVESHNLGQVLTAPMPVKLWSGKFREPDIVFLARTESERFAERYPTGADLVMEVVSGSGIDRERDLVIKRQEYAEAGIPEYWIVDPQEEQITVCHLAAGSDEYEEVGVYGPGEQAKSVLLAGFGVEVTAVFAAAD